MAEFSKQIYGSKRAVLPLMMTMMMVVVIFIQRIMQP
jgi:hypothetical protein